MSVIPDATIRACHQNATGSKPLERKISSINLNVCQSTGIEKDDDSRQSLENHAKNDEIRRFYDKKFDDGHDVHRAMALVEDYSQPTKRSDYQSVSGIMKISYNPFLSIEAEAAYMNFEITELRQFWTEKIVQIDSAEREKPSLCLLFKKVPEVICVPRSEKKVELRMGGEDKILSTNLGTVWRLQRPSWCPHPHANWNEEVKERVRLSPGKDEGLGSLNVIHKLTLHHREESKETASKSSESSKKWSQAPALIWQQVWRTFL